MKNPALKLDDVSLSLAEISVESFEVSFGDLSTDDMAFLANNMSSCPTTDGCQGCGATHPAL